MVPGSRATSSALRSKKLCGRGLRRMAAPVAGTEDVPTLPSARRPRRRPEVVAPCGSALLFTLLLLRGGAASKLHPRPWLRRPHRLRPGCGVGCGLRASGGAALPGRPFALFAARLGRTRLPEVALAELTCRRRLRRARLRRARSRGAAPGAAGLLRGVCLHGTRRRSTAQAHRRRARHAIIEQRFRAVLQWLVPGPAPCQDAEDGFRAERLDDGLCGLLPDPAVAPDR